MSTDSIATARFAPVSLPERADALIAVRGLMVELETSLDCSRQALLALDLAGIERQTDEQVELIRKLEKFLPKGMPAPASVRHSEEDARSARSVLSAFMPVAEEEVRRNANRIAEAARLQAALLRRAQCKLRIMANMLAGPSVTYGPFRGWSGAPTAAPFSAAGESDSCRV
jgi:hypothetical protein